MMMGCSSKSVLRSGEEEVRCSSRGVASTASVEGGVEGGEDERCLASVSVSVSSLFITPLGAVWVEVVLVVSSVSFDTSMVYLYTRGGEVDSQNAKMTTMISRLM